MRQIILLIVFWTVLISAVVLLQKKISKKKSLTSQKIGDSRIEVSEKRYKMASDYLLIIGLAHLLLFIFFFGTYISFFYLVFGIVFLILSGKVKKKNNRALKAGIVLYFLIILVDGVYLIWNYNWILLIILLIKFTVLLYLVNPFRKPTKEEVWEKGISKLPYVVPIITVVPFFVVFFIIYLATDNIFYSFLAYLPPILFLLIWLWITKKRRHNF